MSVLGAIMVPHPPILLPEVGGEEAKALAVTAAAYERAAAFAAALRPDTVVVASPHSVLYADYFHISPGENARGDMGQFRAPQLRFRAVYDAAFVTALSARCERAGIPAGRWASALRRSTTGR